MVAGEATVTCKVTKDGKTVSREFKMVFDDTIQVPAQKPEANKSIETEKGNPAGPIGK